MSPSTRRLAAVWFADVVGYTSLSSRDEEAALALIDLFQRVSEEAITAHGGRLVHFIGDAVLADFQSTEAAVRAALTLRDHFITASRDQGTPSNLRIGVHVGDVNTTPTGDLFGDGVNTASRLTEQVALPGQVVVSQDVWRHLKPRTEFFFSSMGQHRLEGISTEVWVFAAERESERTAAADAERSLPGSPFGVRVRALVRSVVFYLTAAFVVLVFGGRVRTGLGLPAWTLPVAVFLLAVGLVVIVATSWTQTRPTWQRSVRSQQRPWQLDLREVGTDLAGRRLPELTWPRAIMGGVFAFALLIAAGAAYMLLDEGSSGLLTPRQAYAAPGPGLAVLPFDVEGDDEGLWSEGMVDLLSMTMDGAGGLRVIDPRVVVSRWDDAVADQDLASKLELARWSDASFVVLGSLRSTGDAVRITASLYDTQRGVRLGQTEVSGPIDSLPRLVEELSTGILAMGITRNGSTAREPRLPELSTASPVALRAYLAGEQFFRQSRWHEAQLEFRDAVAADPQFALALYRLSLTEAWSRIPHVPQVDDWGERAARFVDGLTERDSLLIQAYEELSQGSSSALPSLDAFTRRYPDDVEGWFLLGDAYYHLDLTSAGSGRRFRRAFREAIRLDPGFGPAYLHLIEDAVQRGDTIAANATLAEFRRADPGSPLLTGFDWGYALSRATNREDVGSEQQLPAAAPPASEEADVDTAPGRAEAEWMRRVAAARTAVERQRSGALVGSPELERGRDWEQRAAQAERSERWPEVLESLQRAEESYRLARSVEPEPSRAVADSPTRESPAPTPAVRTDVEPEVQPRAVAAQTLGQLARAIEGEDIESLRRVWPGLSAEGAHNWQQLFAQASQLQADFTVLDAQLGSGDRLNTRVRWTYSYQNAGTRRRETQSSSQTLTLLRQGSGWVIVDNGQ